MLIVEGELDVRMPLEEQAAATAGLRNAQRFRNSGHDLFEANPTSRRSRIAFFTARPMTTRELVLPAPSADR